MFIEATDYEDARRSIPDAIREDYETSLLWMLWEHRLVFFSEDEYAREAPMMTDLKALHQIDSFANWPDSDLRPNREGWFVGLGTEGRSRVHRAMIAARLGTPIDFYRREREQCEEELESLRARAVAAARYVAMAYGEDLGPKADEAARYQAGQLQRYSDRMKDVQQQLAKLRAHERYLLRVDSHSYQRRRKAA